MTFFQLNWIIIFITILFLFGFIVLESKFKLISEVLKTKPLILYLIITVFGAFASFLNYLAIAVIGSWELFVMIIVIGIILLTIVLFMIRRKIKQYRVAKELKELRKENEALQKNQNLDNDIISNGELNVSGTTEHKKSPIEE
ncbi:hypothetical protein ERUR111494_08530 [Erysipelothrix urinaevulpis]|uniref:hypothetical protein n=1 Tax=Erysipelothrix urinaevulpis TaxID=2683717 RepID=UPI00135BCED0|nr:hypothetical protein [Erysipelothrix urinaevulpis]